MVLVRFRTDVYLIFTIHQMHAAFGETNFEAKWFHSTYFLKGGSATTALKKRGLRTYLQHVLYIKKGGGETYAHTTVILPVCLNELAPNKANCSSSRSSRCLSAPSVLLSPSYSKISMSGSSPPPSPPPVGPASLGARHTHEPKQRGFFVSSSGLPLPHPLRFYVRYVTKESSFFFS